MRGLGVVVALLLAACSPASAEGNGNGETGVVGLVVTHQAWDADRPWAKKSPQTRRANGVVVEGPYILTTAQMVADATFVQVVKAGRATQATTRTVVVDREIDLALLAVDSQGFFDDLHPVPLADETPIRGSLRTVRWQGQQLESLAARVKRFEVQESHFGKLEHAFLLAQTDMSGGGWAEPVFDDGHLAGITISQKDANVRILPVEIIARFLERARDPNGYREFPVFGVKWQVNENPALVAFLGQTGKPRGVLIRQVPWGSSGCGVLKPRDILLSVNGRPIDSQGFYSHPRLGQLLFTHMLIDGHEVGDVVPVRVLRAGEERELEMTLRAYPLSTMLMPERSGDDPPPYVVAGGLLMRELDGDYLRSWGREWTKRAPLHLLTFYFLERSAQRPDRRRVILLTTVLPSAYTVGYQGVGEIAVETINGRPIDSIAGVLEALEQPLGGFHVIGLHRNAGRHEIVLDAAGLEQATEEILETYRIPQAHRLPTAAAPDGGPDCDGDR